VNWRIDLYEKSRRDFGALNALRAALRAVVVDQPGSSKQV